MKRVCKNIGDFLAFAGFALAGIFLLVSVLQSKSLQQFILTYGFSLMVCCLLSALLLLTAVEKYPHRFFADGEVAGLFLFGWALITVSLLALAFQELLGQLAIMFVATALLVGGGMILASYRISRWSSKSPQGG